MKTRKAPQKARRKVFAELGNETHPPPTHTIGELAKALKKSRQTIGRAIKDKQIVTLPLVGEHQRISHREYLRLTTGRGEPLPD